MKLFLCSKSCHLKRSNKQGQFMYSEKLYKYNPIDDIEHLFAKRQHSIERRSNHEVVVEISGKWDDMLFFFAWEEEMHCMHISCLMNIEPASTALPNIFELLALLNEDMWIGYFSYWEETKMPLFKHSVILENNDPDIFVKLDRILNIAVTECERAYPIFHAVFKQNISPRRAVMPMALM